MQVLSPSEGSLFEIVVACGEIIDSSSNPACPKNPKWHKNMNHFVHFEVIIHELEDKKSNTRQPNTKIKKIVFR